MDGLEGILVSDLKREKTPCSKKTVKSINELSEGCGTATTYSVSHSRDCRSSGPCVKTGDRPRCYICEQSSQRPSLSIFVTYSDIVAEPVNELDAVRGGQ